MEVVTGRARDERYDFLWILSLVCDNVDTPDPNHCYPVLELHHERRSWGKYESQSHSWVSIVQPFARPKPPVSNYPDTVSSLCHCLSTPGPSLFYPLVGLELRVMVEGLREASDRADRVHCAASSLLIPSTPTVGDLVTHQSKKENECLVEARLRTSLVE